MLCLPHSTAKHLVMWRHGGLAEAVDRLAGERDEAGLRAHVDDAAALPRAIMCLPAYWLRKNADLTFRSMVKSKSASVKSSIGPSVPPPTLLTRMSRPAEGGDRRVDRGIGLRQVACVHLQRQRACGRMASISADDAGVLVDVAKAERDDGAGIGKGHRDGAAETAGGAGDERGLSREAEVGQRFHVYSPSGSRRAPRPARRPRPCRRACRRPRRPCWRRRSNGWG